jgi:hypothetical protein
MYERMPWGKYRGLLLSEIPTGYLYWLLDRADAAGAGLKSSALEELRRRGCVGPSAAANTGTAVLDIRATIKAWFAGLARDYHPDRTGDDGKVMAALNDAHERLRKLVGGS